MNVPHRGGTLAGLVLLLAALQGARFGLKELFFLLLPRTNFGDRLASLFAMLFLSALLFLLAARLHEPLSVFPAHFGPLYITATLLALALLVSTPFLTGETAAGKLVLLAYSAIVLPLFEEPIFRGLVWNRLAGVFRHEWVVLPVLALLFGLWHLGYADSLALRVGGGPELLNALFWKFAVGLGYGLVLGALRLKAKNCYATMLAHGVLNLLGR